MLRVSLVGGPDEIRHLWNGDAADAAMSVAVAVVAGGAIDAVLTGPVAVGDVPFFVARCFGHVVDVLDVAGVVGEEVVKGARVASLELFLLGPRVFPSSFSAG